MNRWTIYKDSAALLEQDAKKFRAAQYIDGPDTSGLPGFADSWVRVVPESVLLSERARSAKLAEALRMIDGGHTAATHRQGIEQFKAVARAALVEYEEGEASDD